MRRNLRKSANAERVQSVLVLKSAEFSLDGGAAVVEVAEALRVAGDKRVSAVSLDPDGLGLTRIGWTTPLGRTALEIGSGKYPTAVLAVWGAMLAALDGGRLAKGHDREDAALGTLAIDAIHIEAAIHRACQGTDSASGEHVEKRGHLGGLVRPRCRNFP